MTLGASFRRIRGRGVLTIRVAGEAELHFPLGFPREGVEPLVPYKRRPAQLELVPRDDDDEVPSCR